MIMIFLLFYLFYGYLSNIMKREIGNKIDKKKWFGNFYLFYGYIRMYLLRFFYWEVFSINNIYKINSIGVEIS